MIEADNMTAATTPMPEQDAMPKGRTRRTRKIDRTGLPVEHQRLRHMLFTGRTAKAAASKCGTSIAEADQILRELKAAGCGPKDAGPFTVAQAAVVLGLRVRRTRTLCEHGRIGIVIGGSVTKRSYVVPREHLEAFGARERLSGHPGQVARQEERAAMNGHDE
jgi:hypothetical protein